MSRSAASAPGAKRPVTLLIAALGGEGGGVLTDWIVNAAAAEGYPVQSTSIPGVAQRTGATTYYVEIFPVPLAELDGRAPVFALYPAPGDIDIMVASELIEAGRAMENGYVSPDRTTLIASTHRVYAIAEKSAMSDGTFDGARVVKAAEALAMRPVLFDFQALAQAHGSAINALLLGALAGSDGLPVGPQALEQAVRASGIAVEANLAGFAAGRACVRGELAAPPAAGPRPRSWLGRPLSAEALVERARAEFPGEAHPVLEQGVRRLADYQGAAYAALYLDRLAPVLSADKAGAGRGRGFALTREAGRYLALWMSYEDVIRVAELKTRRERFAAVRQEAGAKADEPVQITEFLKPGVEEVAAVLPPALGRRLLAWAGRRRRWKLHVPMRVRTDTVGGFLRLWLLARLKGWRPRTLRYADEQARIGRWLEAVSAAAARDYGLALEVVECANLLKGYGETHARGRGSFERIFASVVAPALAGGAAVDWARGTVRRAREAALADPEGTRLDEVLAAAPVKGEARAAAE